jgi:predicted nucleic acid-binding protein
MSVLLDSCILIDFLLGHTAAREYVSRLDGAAISMITWMEVAVGGASPEEDVVLRAFLSSFEVLPIDTHIAEEAVRLRRTRRLKLPMNLA